MGEIPRTSTECHMSKSCYIYCYILWGKNDNWLHLCIDETDEEEFRFSKNGPMLCSNFSLQTQISATREL